MSCALWIALADRTSDGAVQGTGWIVCVTVPIPHIAAANGQACLCKSAPEKTRRKLDQAHLTRAWHCLT